jgi:hypothetical protein
VARGGINQPCRVPVVAVASDQVFYLLKNKISSDTMLHICRRSGPWGRDVGVGSAALIGVGRSLGLASVSADTQFRDTRIRRRRDAIEYARTTGKCFSDRAPTSRAVYSKRGVDTGTPFRPAKRLWDK